MRFFPSVWLLQASSCVNIFSFLQVWSSFGRSSSLMHIVRYTGEIPRKSSFHVFAKFFHSTMVCLIALCKLMYLMYRYLVAGFCFRFLLLIVVAVWTMQNASWFPSQARRELGRGMERAQCSPSNIFAGDFFAGCLGRNIFPGVLSRCFDLSAMISLLDAMSVISVIFQVLGWVHCTPVFRVLLSAIILW